MTKKPYDVSNFSVDSFISEINSVLWDFIKSITKGMGRTEMTNEKRLACVFCLCLLLFCANRKCCIPLHLLTDVIDAHGGSKELIKILNHFGAIASLKTHRRHVQYRIQSRIQEGVTSNLQKNTFTIVYVDNIDFLQSSALVYCGDQSRSWHGTTVQAVQPFVSGSACSTDNDSGQHITQSPTSSPLHKKTKRRSRTMSESTCFQDLLNHSSFELPHLPLSLKGRPHPLQHLSNNQYMPLKNGSLNDFHISVEEGMHILTFQHHFLLT